MRLNRGTFVLIIASLAVIIAMVLLSSSESTNTTATPTAAAAGAGPLFPEISALEDQNNIVRFEIVDNSITAAGSKVVMTKDEAGVWTVAEATNAQDLATDQTKAVGNMSNLASLAAVDSFELSGSQTLADFGLDQPKYTLTLTDSDGKTYTVKTGNKATATPRYYVLVNDNTTTVYIVQQSTIDMLTSNIANPAYVASPTPTTTPTSTPNPYSEVEQTATAGAEMQQLFITLTAMAQPTSEATAEVTAEATAEAVAPSATPVPPTATSVPPTATQVPPSATPLPPTATEPPPTATATRRPATATTVPSVTPTLTSTPRP